MSDTAVAGTPQRDYSRARLNCGVVMKGGIASGIVYPGAVWELATVYRFKNIGGTSAGAIAAAAAAAAEYGRRHDAQGAGRSLSSRMRRFAVEFSERPPRCRAC